MYHTSRSLEAWEKQWIAMILLHVLLSSLWPNPNNHLPVIQIAYLKAHHRLQVQTTAL